MSEMLPIIFVVAAIIIVLALILFLSLRRSGSSGGQRKERKRDRPTIIKEANRRLAQNPKDIEALKTLSDLYYQEEAWEKAMKTYGALMDLVSIDGDISEFEVTFRYAVAAMKLKNFEEAYKGFFLAHTKEPDGFEVNYNLGFLEYRRKNYEKAAQLLKNALAKQADHVPTMKYLGHASFKLGRSKEALPLLKKVIDLEPEDKETLFAIGECFYNLGMADQAVRVFTHMRPDPNLGPQAALMAGSIHLNMRAYEKAIMDFEIGLRHAEMKAEINLELKYRLAAAYIKLQEIAKALPLLQQIRVEVPTYKDVEAQIARYRELNSNKNLQVYLMSSSSDFVALCRKMVVGFISQSKVKILNIELRSSEFCDILAEVETAAWQDVILFRFIRSTGQIGELMLRDFHAHLKDSKSGRGFCITAGEYTEGAKKFVEARLIDLIDKERLVKVLNSA